MIGKGFTRVVARTALVVLVVASALTGTQTRAGSEPGVIRVSEPWARASVGASRSGVVYLTIENHGKAATRLIGVRTPAAATAMIHSTVIEGEIMRMRHVGSLELPPGQPVKLEPGGLHIMLMDLREPLVKGEKLGLRLEFEGAAPLEVEVPIAAAGAASAPPGGAPPHHH